MKLHTGLVTVGLLSLGLLSYSCANGDTVSGTTGNGTGNGGSNSTGTGGSSSTGTGGNSTGTGGTHTGGTTGAGGTHTGGSTGTGGIIAGGTGGTHTGGTTGTGGIVTTGTGGTVVTGTGGTTVSCPTTFTPTTGGYVFMPAVGGTCWHGYAYNFADAMSTITPGTTMTYATCTTTCALTAMGTVAIANAANNYATYAGIGFNINQDQAGGTAAPTLVPAGTSLTITFTGTTGTSPLRAQISDGTTNWCYAITGASPVTIPYTSFNTKCYDTPADGVAYAKNPINAFQLQVAGAATAGTYNIALTGMKEN
jgi:hypothetical protein